jgi:lipoate-protein ligase A
LALENYLLLNIPQNQEYLLLYINRPCVVIGRFQNPWVECNLGEMEPSSVELVRRQSGGGTVYHDQNNINYCLISPKSLYDKKKNFIFLNKVLGNLGIDSFDSPRGDLRLVEDLERKISGTAYKEKKDSAFQHGTMLIDSDLTLLNHFIKPSLVNITSKSIDSVRSTVANLSDVNKSITCEGFIRTAASEFSGHDNIIEVKSDSELARIVYSDPYFEKVTSALWVYSETPQFEVESTFGNINIHLVIKKLIIVECSIDSIDYHPLLVSAISSGLKKCHLFSVSLLLENEFKEEEISKKLNIWFNDYFGLEHLP